MKETLLKMIEKVLKKRITADNIREVICYNHNFLTGEHYETKKLKPDKGVKTKIKILLEDVVTGKIVQEAVTENILGDYMAKLAFNEWFLDDLQPPNPDNTDTWGYLFKDIPGNIPFKRIFLTDYTGAESASHDRIKGELIGFARKDDGYVGTDILRGTINRLESEVTFNGSQITIHIVFDFPTHAANGTFQSIWWGCDTSQMGAFRIEKSAKLDIDPAVTNRYYNFLTISKNIIPYIINSNFSRYLGKFRFHSCCRYNQDGSGTWTVYKLDAKYMQFLSTPVKLKWSDGTDFKDDNLQSCIAYDDYVIGFYYNSSSYNQTYNGHVYLAYTLYKFIWNTADGTLVSMTPLNRSALRDAGNRDLVWIADLGQVQTIIDQDIYIWGYYDLTTEYKQYRIKLNTAFTGIAESLLITPVVPSNLQYYKDYPADTGKKNIIRKAVVMKDYIKIQWNNGNSSSGNYCELYDRSYNHITYLLNPYDYGCWEFDNNIPNRFPRNYWYDRFCNTNKVFTIIDGAIYCWLKHQRPCAHSLLAAPVTKTPTNTMKIQYDFIIDYVDIEET